MNIEVTLLFTLIVLLLTCAGIGLGSLLGRSAIRGSCGGIMSDQTQEDCHICGRKVGSCESKK